MVGPVRLELTTPCLKCRCSNLLSYGPASAPSIIAQKPLCINR